MKVQLRSNIRIYDFEESGFMIMPNEVLELHAKFMKSYQIKEALFKGILVPKEGTMMFNVKAASVYVDAKYAPLLYGKEYGKYFEKDTSNDTIYWKADDEIPKEAYLALNGSSVEVRVVEAPKVEDVIKYDEVVEEVVEEKPNFDGMTRDQLNDFAARHGVEQEITADMKLKNIRKKMHELFP